MHVQPSGFRRGITSPYDLRHWGCLLAFFTIHSSDMRALESAAWIHPSIISMTERRALQIRMVEPASDSAARLDGTLAYLRVAAGTLSDMASAFHTPFMQTIANTTGSLITGIQNLRRNKSECIEMMEQVQNILAVIIQLELDSRAQQGLGPQALSNFGNFTKTLHKLDAFMNSQQQTNRFTQFLRQHEMNLLLKDCQLGLQQALEIFKVTHHVNTLAEMNDMRARAEQQHEELLESLANLSLTGTSAPSLSAPRYLTSSSNSLSMIPAKPQIFHGRHNELEEIARTIVQPNPACIAILGPGGIGKTALAKAVLHHPAVQERFPREVFVRCDTASDQIELAALIASYIGLKAERDLTRAVLRQISNGPATLLVLDNIETAWEAMQARVQVEDFLSLLSEIPHLGLLITLRGIERPGKIQWNRPFLPPLGPVSADAARQILVDIADDIHNARELDQVLALTDNVPLAIELVAHLVDFEGPAYILERWESERISLLSNGADGGNALEISIGISLSSPRLAASPGAWDLLRLLSILSDGLSDAELQHIKLPITNILSSKVTLTRISLAYISHDGRLKMLNPTREFILRAHPPSTSLVLAVVEYFHALLEL
ncbi:P-loop containing nucleoside triphosphate hydrolase protein, partial [Mycena amicta]